MSSKQSKEYKPDSVIDKTTKDLVSDLKDFNVFCFEAIRSKPFWSPTDRLVFVDRWTVYMQKLLLHGKSLHGFDHRIVLDEDDHEENVEAKR